MASFNCSSYTAKRAQEYGWIASLNYGKGMRECRVIHPTLKGKEARKAWVELIMKQLFTMKVERCQCCGHRDFFLARN
jgi:hypothetical protein